MYIEEPVYNQNYAPPGYQPEYPEQYPGRMNEQPMLPEPQDTGAVYPNQDTGFLQWLFSFRKEAITPLRNVWRGKEFDFKLNSWIESKSKLKIMNEDGVTWAISLIESYMSPVYITTDFDYKTYAFTMRECAKIIWNSLSLRYKEFEMVKSDIPRVAEEIESKVRAILRGALNDGYRSFFSTQNQNIETKNLSQQPQQPRPGLFTNMANVFRKLDQPGMSRQY